MRNLLILVLALSLAAPLPAQSHKKKNGTEDDITQTLPALPDPPLAITAETGRLIFQVSALTTKGLMSQQTRDALHGLIGQAHGATIVKLRAFIAGSGDLRRIQTLVAEVFTEKKLPLPALSLVQAGALPLESAQVVIESTAADSKKVVNPNGLAFFSGQQAKDVHQAVGQLQAAASAAGVGPKEMLRVTCFLSSIEQNQAALEAVSAAFPTSAMHAVQLQRLGMEPLAECEGVGRLSREPPATVMYLNPPGLVSNPNYSQIALVHSPKVTLTGTRMIFHDQDTDIRLGFERLGKALEAEGVGYKDVFWSSSYPLTRSIADKIRAIRFDYYDRTHAPASTFLLFEGLPSIDATAAFDVIAAKN